MSDEVRKGVRPMWHEGAKREDQFLFKTKTGVLTPLLQRQSKHREMILLITSGVEMT